MDQDEIQYYSPERSPSSPLAKKVNIMSANILFDAPKSPIIQANENFKVNTITRPLAHSQRNHWWIFLKRIVTKMQQKNRNVNKENTIKRKA